jgi:hypothetical protein
MTPSPLKRTPGKTLLWSSVSHQIERSNTTTSSRLFSSRASAVGPISYTECRRGPPQSKSTDIVLYTFWEDSPVTRSPCSCCRASVCHSSTSCRVPAKKKTRLKSQGRVESMKTTRKSLVVGGGLEASTLPVYQLV